MIYWTGDLPPHDIWEQTRSDQVSILQHLTDKLLKYFPDKLVFSAVGNHESAPVDRYVSALDKRQVFSLSLPVSYGFGYAAASLRPT